MGWVLKADLDQIIKTHITQRFWRSLLLGLILIAIFIGNSVYQGGNLSGTLLGLQSLMATDQHKFLMLFLIGILVLFFLWKERFEAIKRFLTLMVFLMGVSFAITAVALGPGLLPLLKAILLPRFNAESTLTVIALVGTTVVPYNLFLHAALVRRAHAQISGLRALRQDAATSILIGGLISMAILITAASVQADQVRSVVDLIGLLEPYFGQASRYIIGFGLFAAGLTSSITAPLAAGLVAQSVLTSTTYDHPHNARRVSILVFAIGLLIALIGSAPIKIIKFAQVANGLLLPIIATTLYVLSSKTSVMGNHVNNRLQQLIGALLVLFTLVLGSMALYKTLV